MRKIFVVAAVAIALATLLLIIGCTSPSAKAQKLFDEGKYEEVIAQYGADPNLATIVMQAKEKLAEKLVSEGKYAMVVEMYPETAAAKDAQNKLAEQLFMAKNYAEVIAKYPETTWAAMAKAEMEKMSEGESSGEVKKPSGDKPKEDAPPSADVSKEKAAQAEFDRIMNVKMKDLRMKALREFAANPAYAGTKAAAAAQAELAK